MTMPEAAVNKNDGSMAWQDNVRVTWEGFLVETETETQAM